MAGSNVTLFFSTVSSNKEIKKHQQKIQMVLDGKKIPYTVVDISADEEQKSKMRGLAGPESMPPQISNGDQYAGGFEEFEEAVENETLSEFLKL